MILNARFSQTFHWFNEAEIDCLESLPNLPTIQKIVQVWFVMRTFYITTSSIYKNRSKTRNSGPRACQSKNDEDECVRLYYHIQYNLYMLLLIVQKTMQVPWANAANRGDRRMRMFCVSDTGEIETETWVLGLGWWRVVDPCGSMVLCKLQVAQVGKAWRNRTCNRTSKPSYVKSEELDKRVPVVSGASCSRTASEWIEVARKRSWTPSARISGAAHISIWSYYLECILLHCLLQKWTIHRFGNLCWKQALWWFEVFFALYVVWRHRKLQKSKKWWKSMKPSCVEKKPWQRQRCHCGSLVEWTHDIEMISIYYISSKRYKKRIPKRDRYTQKSHAQRIEQKLLWFSQLFLKGCGDHVGVDSLFRKPWLWTPLTPVSLQNGSRPGRKRRKRKNMNNKIDKQREELDEMMGVDGSNANNFPCSILLMYFDVVSKLP